MEALIYGRLFTNLIYQNIDIILHQAALGSVPRSIDNPILTNRININGFLNILWAAKKQNIKRVVYAASSSTYGDSKEIPKIEENIGKPLSPYAVTKYVNELCSCIVKRMRILFCFQFVKFVSFFRYFTFFFWFSKLLFS